MSTALSESHHRHAAVFLQVILIKWLQFCISVSSTTETHYKLLSHSTLAITLQSASREAESVNSNLKRMLIVKTLIPTKILTDKIWNYLLCSLLIMSETHLGYERVSLQDTGYVLTACCSFSEIWGAKLVFKSSTQAEPSSTCGGTGWLSDPALWGMGWVDSTG